MRLHLVCLPHTRVTRDFATCAYTQKALKFTKMMDARGHEVVMYAPEGSDDTHAELVQTLTEDERISIFGEDDPRILPAWPSDEQFALANARALAGIIEKAEKHELILLSSGWSQRMLMDALPDRLLCEPFVGYEGIATPYCAFESNAWRHFVYGQKSIGDGRWYDAAIPNYFDVEDFPDWDNGPRDYLLFVGRLIERKGPHIALQIAKACGMPIKFAGPGALGYEDGSITCPWGKLEGDLEYLGPIGIEERGKLMAGARALLVPTTYIEPFGGVAVEGMLCGTPAITSPWGAFSETVEDGLTGFRFSTLAEAQEAVEAAASLDHDAIRARAIERFSLESVGLMFEQWFENLMGLWDVGWHAPARAREAVA